MATTAPPESRRFLIGVGLPRCDRMGLEPLDYVESDVARVVEWLTREQGYTRVLAEEIPIGAPAPDIRRELSRWFASKERRNDDTVLVYFAGHGGPGGKGNRHFLFTTDSDPGQPDQTAVETAGLGRIFFDGEGMRPQNVLLILDTCYSGAGSGQAAGLIAAAKGELLESPGCGFWVVASAGPSSGADDGMFVSALLESIKTENCSPRGNAKFVDLSELIEQVNEWFRDHQHPQEAELDLVGNRRRPRFFRNLNHTDRLDGSVLSDEGHWNPKARGVEEFSSAGWFFTGRYAARRKLVAWLDAQRSDGRARVVTGRPGSGKSALLGWLVVCSHEASREIMQGEGVVLEPETSPAIKSIDAAVHARGANCRTVMQQLTACLESDATDVVALLRALELAPRPTRIILDALDESMEPERIKRELLQPLAASPAVRLIVGSRRRGDWIPLAGAAEVIDLDAPEFFKPDDIARYVQARLIRGAAAPDGAKYQEADARRIALQVAAKADKSFLYARIVSRQIANARPIDTSRERWEDELPLPDDLPEAFGADLERFPPEQRRRFVDLLVPLAYSRGKGMPQKHLWCLLASRISRRSGDQAYTNSDIRELRETAGFYIVQDSEFGEVVFRLFHQSFADYLKSVSRDEAVDQRIAETLWALDDPPDGRGGWLRRSEPYVEHYLPAHAAAGGVLERLLIEPDFLLRSSPNGLLPQLPMVSGGESRAVARAYRRASLWLKNRDETERVSYLATALFQEGMAGIVERLQQVPRYAPWMPAWVRWKPLTPSHAIADGVERIVGLNSGEWEPGKPVVIVGRSPGVEVWDLHTHEQLAAWKPGHVLGGAEHVALTSAGGGKLLIAAWNSGYLGVYNVSTQEVTISRPGWKVRALCISEQESRPTLITASDDLRINIWELPSLTMLCERCQATSASIFVLRVLDINGSRFLLSGGDSFKDGKRCENSRLRIWSLSDLAPIWGDDRGGRGCIKHLAIGRSGDRCLAVASQDDWAPVEIWDLGSKTLVYEGTSQESFYYACILPIDGEPLMLRERYGRLAAYKLVEASVVSGRPIELEMVAGEIPIQGALISDIVQVDDRWLLMTTSAGRVKVWDIAELVALQRPWDIELSDADACAQVLAIEPETGRDVFVATRSERIVTLNAETGVERWTEQIGEGAPITCVACLKQVLVLGAQGAIHFWDLQGHRPFGNPIEAGNTVQNVAVVESRGRQLVIATVSAGVWAMRVWDLKTREELSPKPPDDDDEDRHFTYQLMFGEEDKPLYGLAASDLNGRVRIAFASKYGKVMVADFGEDAVSTPPWPGYKEWRIPGANPLAYTRSLVSGQCSGAALLMAGSDEGCLTVWNFESSELLASRPDAHLGSINAIGFFPAQNCELLVSGGDDGAVRFWTAGLTKSFTVEVGEQILCLVPAGYDRLAIGTGHGVLMLKIDRVRLLQRLGRAFLPPRSEQMELKLTDLPTRDL